MRIGGCTMVCKVNLYKNTNPLEVTKEKLGIVLVEQHKDGRITELFSNDELNVYVTADQKGHQGETLYFPDHEYRERVNEEIEEKGYSLYVVFEEIDYDSEITREDLDYYMNNQKNYSYNKFKKGFAINQKKLKRGE